MINRAEQETQVCRTE